MLEMRVFIKIGISETLIVSYYWGEKKKKNISKTSKIGSVKIRNYKPMFIFQSEENLFIHF